LLYLLRCDGEDIQYLDHDIHKHLRQINVERTLCINLEALKEILHAPKEVKESIVARRHILCRLSNLALRGVQRTETRRIQTVRRIPIPVKIAFAGGNA